MAENSRDTAPITLLDLDRETLGTLSPERKAALESRLADDAEFRAQADEHRAAHDHFRSRTMAKTLPNVERRLVGKRRWNWLLAPTALAAVAILLLLVRSGGDPLSESGLAAKGDPILQVVAKRGDKQFHVRDGMVLKRGDALKFIVQPVNYRHVLVLGVDHSGKVSTWYPFDGVESAAIAGKKALPGSIILDAAPGKERALGIFSRDIQSAKDWKKRIAAAGHNNLPGADGVFVVALTWQKAEGFGP